jgi:hypothetical protein
MTIAFPAEVHSRFVAPARKTVQPDIRFRSVQHCLSSNGWPQSLQVSLDSYQNNLTQGRKPGQVSTRREAEPAKGSRVHHLEKRTCCGGWKMGRGLLLWLIGIPLPIILVIWLFGGLS